MPERIYWDSTVFIAWLKKEKRDPAEEAGIRHAVSQIERGDAELLVSTVVLTEVLPDRLSDEARTKLNAFFQRKEVNWVAVDRPIALRTRDIRSVKKLKVPDAIHLATAMIYKADKLLTFDGGLLGLNGNALVGSLQIIKPFSPQPNLPDIA